MDHGLNDSYSGKHYFTKVFNTYFQTHMWGYYVSSIYLKPSSEVFQHEEITFLVVYLLSYHRLQKSELFFFMNEFFSTKIFYS